MSMHTPGPWQISLCRPDKTGHVEYQVRRVGATGIHENDIIGWTNESLDPEGVIKANATLMAAAPDLLENLENVTAALETVLAHYEQQMPKADRVQRNALISAARAAIAKATSPEAVQS